MKIDFHNYEYIRYSCLVEIQKQIYSFIQDFYAKYSNFEICEYYEIFLEIEA